MRAAVLKEIFQSALDEAGGTVAVPGPWLGRDRLDPAGDLLGVPWSQVVAETAAPLETLSQPQLLGFMADEALKPDVLFLVRPLGR